MKIGELRRFEPTYTMYPAKHHKLFFIYNIIDDGLHEVVYEVIMIHNGKKHWYTERELSYYSKIIKADKKCP